MKNPLDRLGLKGLVAMIAIIALVPFAFPSSYFYTIGASIFIAAFAAVGLGILMGLAGQVSLGHAGFYAIGAYAVAIGPTYFAIPSWAGILIGLVLAVVLAWFVGRPILKLKGHYLAVATLGFGILVAMALNNEAQWTGGPDGMSVPRLVLFGFPFRGAKMWYWTSAIVLVVGVWLALNLLNSPTGRAMRALHDSEIAASVNGIDTAHYKLLAFMVSAGYASLAGAMASFSDGIVTPTVGGFIFSVELVTMVVLGGMGSVFGSVIGAVVLKALPQVLTFLHDYEHMVLGLIMMLVMIFMRDGILPTIARAFKRRSA